MNFCLTLQFESKAKKLCQKSQQLRQDLTKQFQLFASNPNHPSLKLHKLQGKRSTQYAIWIQSDLRALCIKEGKKYIFFDLVTHDQY